MLLDHKIRVDNKSREKPVQFLSFFFKAASPLAYIERRFRHEAGLPAVPRVYVRVLQLGKKLVCLCIYVTLSVLK